MSQRRPVLAGNWKMHKTVEEARAYARHLIELLPEPPLDRDLLLIPPVVSLWAVQRVLSGTQWQVGAQDVDLGREGAMTGAVSAYLLSEAGARYVVVGHSERRQFFGETDELVAKKAAAVVDAGLIPIVCIGEREEEFVAGHTEEVLARQLAPVVKALPEACWSTAVIAYEPVWAIGTGRVPTPDDANRLARFIRDTIGATMPNAHDQVRVLYGGSVNPGNLAQFWAMPDIDGALVGGASLKADDFAQMALVSID